MVCEHKFHFIEIENKNGIETYHVHDKENGTSTVETRPATPMSVFICELCGYKKKVEIKETE